MKRILIIILALICCSTSLSAQNTFGFTYGVGSGKMRAYPSYETKSIYGLSTFSLQWRNYTPSLYVGCVGVDLEYMQRGFAYAPYTIDNNHDGDNKDKDLLYYRRYINSIMMPLVWQPYVYMFHNRMRVFLDAAITFSYNISSTYENNLYASYGYNDGMESGVYEMRTERDNFLNYGLAFGGGFYYIVDRFEFQASIRYYFGYSDILKNRQLYYTNTSDHSAENPFSYTPMRSPIDNINLKFGVSYRVGKADGYAAWYTERLKSSGLRDGFSFDEEALEGSSFSGSSSKSTSNSQGQRGSGVGSQRNTNFR